MHQIESLVDLLKLEDVGDHRIDLNLSVHVPINDLRDVGAAARTAERGTFPHAAGDELERPGGNLLAGLRDSDDHRDAPATMASLESLAHHVGVSGTVERIVSPAIGQCDEMLYDVASDLRWIDEVRHSEAPTPLRLRIVDIHPDDLVGADHLGALDDIQSDATESEYDNV